jgi:hypothetical protein
MECRRKLGLEGASQQFLVLAPEGSEGAAALQLLPAMLAPALRGTIPSHCCRAVAVDTVQEARYLLSLHSVGGAMVVGKLRTELFPYVKATSAAMRCGAVDLVTKVGEELLGDCVEPATIKSCLNSSLAQRRWEVPAQVPGFEQRNLLSTSAATVAKALEGYSPEEQMIGLVILSDDAPWESQLVGVTARAAQLALVELGIKAFFHGPDDAESALPSEFLNISVERGLNQKLGIDAVDMERNGYLRVVRIGDGLVNDWNEAHPQLRVQSDDVILEVNGRSGNIHHLVDECSKNGRVLNIKIKRPPMDVKDKSEVHDMEDLADLCMLPRLDVVILVGGEQLGGQSGFLEAQLGKLRLNPVRLMVQPWPANMSTLGHLLQRHETEAANRELTRLLLEQVSSITDRFFLYHETEVQNGFKRQMEQALLDQGLATSSQSPDGSFATSAISP